ncbi:MAG: hypothetical protein R3A44_13125 [Caldilineaceae bacterium]
MARQNLEWLFSDADVEAAWLEQTATAQPDLSGADGAPEEANHAPIKLTYLYELICGIALLYGVILYLLWQQTTAQNAVIAQEIIALHNEVSALQQSIRNDEMPLSREASGAGPFHFETAYLSFETSAQSVAIVERIAPRVDARFQQYHHDFGLSLPLSTEKLKIIVDPDVRVDYPVVDMGQLYPATREEQLVVPHPKFTAKQHGASEADVLTTELSSRLAMHLLKKVIASREIKPQWQGMTLALKTHVQLEHGYNRNWQWEDMFLLHRYNAQSASLAFVHDVIRAPEGTNEQWSQPSPSAYATANTLVEFILVTYGDDKVPALLDAFSEHDAWETLTPALFHLSADEFEAQWRAYLRKHYPIPQ